MSKNILHLAPYFPSPKAIHAGGVCMGMEVQELRKFNEVKTLSFVQNRYDLDLFKKEESEKNQGIVINPILKMIGILEHFFYPFYFASRSSHNYKKKLIEMLKDGKIDFVHAEYSAMGQYFKTIRKYSNAKIIYVLHDVTVQSYERKISNSKNIIWKLFYRLEKTKILHYEKKWIDEADYTLVFNEKDKKILSEKYKIDSNKEGIINTYFDLDSKKDKMQQFYRKDDKKINFFFYGQLLRPENEEAARRAIELYKRMKKKIEIDSNLYLVGNCAGSKLLNLQEEDIICTGYVEDADRFIIENCDIAIFPLKSGAGIKVKVLHCLALGLPVITNEIGAEGIDEEGKYIYLAENENDFLKMMQLLVEKGFPIERKRGCLGYIEKNFNWDITKEIFNQIYV